MDTSRLRLETAEDHARVEELLPLTSDTLTQATYTAVLRRLFGFIHGWELWAERHAPPSLRALLAARRRSRLLEQDLQYFGEARPSAVHERPLVGEVAIPQFLGTMYVIEGSTLGGQYIARHVETIFGLEPGHGDAYFRGYGEHTGKMWNEFKAELEQLPDAALAEVSAAARQTFRDFETWMRPAALRGAEL